MCLSSSDQHCHASFCAAEHIGGWLACVELLLSCFGNSLKQEAERWFAHIRLHCSLRQCYNSMLVANERDLLIPACVHLIPCMLIN